MLIEQRIPIAPERRTSYEDLVLDNGLVHRSIYTDPAIFEAEMTQIFGGNWVFLLHESEIAKPNDFKVVTVGRRSTIVTRTESGELVAFLNRCTHRGSPVCLENAGNRSRFTCPYHGWTFSNNGQLASITFPDGYGADFDYAAHRLGRLPRVESYRGFVFGSLNPAVEPLDAWLGEARDVFDWAVEKDAIGPNGVSVVESVKMTYHGNWKQQNDNNTDGYHTPFLHKATNLMNARRHGPGKWLSHVTDRTGMVCQYFGNGHKMGDHRAELRSSWHQARPFPGREAFAEELERECGQQASERYLELVGRAGINLVIYPNLLIMGNGMFAVFEPVAVDRTHVRYFTTLINDAPDAVNKLRIRFDEDFHSLGSRDDSEIMERVQHALTTIPEMEWLDVSRGMCRQSVDPQTGVVTSNKTDDTAIRGAYGYWKTQMARPVRLKLD
ncbi:aromatic ring-hydroxylating oxygenase subunit alpha [Paraburkholderia sp.]|uniref:aromatic ring-hydroxylating oxygenase subunit alpha n=1 Tax=Paraburkholderia sp. TaxID=1926495 RepID=UPI0039E5757C